MVEYRWRNFIKIEGELYENFFVEFSNAAFSAIKTNRLEVKLKVHGVLQMHKQNVQRTRLKITVNFA